jgi:four helix bundle protein
MKMQGTKAKNFTEFRPWHEGHKLVLTTYRFLRAFPDEGQFSLRDEMKKAVVSVTNNIAEGYACDSAAERMNFFVLANAAMVEFQNCLLIARDVGYLKSAYFDEIARQAAIVNRQLAGLVSATKKER